MSSFDATIKRLTEIATEETQSDISAAFDVRFGSPVQRLIAELGLYAKHLQTWTCNSEEFGEVRPLRELLNDAALVLRIQAKHAVPQADAQGGACG